jgi:hypothetical protein
MIDRIELRDAEPVAKQKQEPAAKKPFVVPTISVPVDVLEATTFFQAVESGSTN